MKPGEVYWVDFHDSASRGQSGKRPAIVCQDDTRFAGTLAATRRLCAAERFEQE